MREMVDTIPRTSWTGGLRVALVPAFASLVAAPLGSDRDPWISNGPTRSGRMALWLTGSAWSPGTTRRKPRALEADAGSNLGYVRVWAAAGLRCDYRNRSCPCLRNTRESHSCAAWSSGSPVQDKPSGTGRV